MKPYYTNKLVTIFHGDCLDILPELAKVDLVLTDPPYGIQVDSRMHAVGGTQSKNAAAPKRHYDATDWDYAPDIELLKGYVKKANASIIWGGNYFDLPPARCFLVWDKENGTNKFADAELAWTNLDQAVRLKRHMWNGMLRDGREIRNTHPTQKPLAVMTWCIEQSKTTGTILDPFLGSGTTAVAAMLLNRKCIGIEIEEKYCEISAKRCEEARTGLTPAEQAEGQLTLFDE